MTAIIIYILKKKKPSVFCFNFGDCVFQFKKAECTAGTWWVIKSLDLLRALASNFVRGTVRFYGAMNVKDLTAGNDR